MDIHFDNVPHIVTAYCVLHNEVHGDSFNGDWLQQDDDDSIETDIPHGDYHYSSSSCEGVAIRNNYISGTFVIINKTHNQHT